MERIARRVGGFVEAAGEDAEAEKERDKLEEEEGNEEDGEWLRASAMYAGAMAFIENGA